MRLFSHIRQILKRSTFYLVFLLSIASVTFLSTISPAQLSIAQKVEIQPPLSTRGADIIDAKQRSILLRGVNWFGMETETQAPHGVWARDYKEICLRSKAWDTT